MGRINHRQYIIDAIATYICVIAMRNGTFTREVDTAEIRQTFDASSTEQEKAYLKAREILRDFL